MVPHPEKTAERDPVSWEDGLLISVRMREGIAAGKFAFGWGSVPEMGMKNSHHRGHRGSQRKSPHYLAKLEATGAACTCRTGVSDLHGHGLLFGHYPFHAHGLVTCITDDIAFSN